jgi:hypothetical protein
MMILRFALLAAFNYAALVYAYRQGWRYRQWVMTPHNRIVKNKKSTGQEEEV